MLSVSPPLTAGQSEYYANLATEDYYLKGGEPPGQWYGSGADALGLSGRVDLDQFRELFTGKLQDRKLVQNAGQETRVPGWDLTFSAPKSVSVAWSQGDLATSQEIRAAHQEAVEKALSFLEREAGFSRTGKLGQNVTRAGLVFATFEHGTSRAQEPQLHTHSILMNVGTRPNGSTGTIFMQPLYKHKVAAGALYRAELAYQLNRRLGLEVERDENAKFSFRLKGVNRELEEHFSTRRKEVEAHLAERGLSGAVASSRMTVFSRTNKEHAPREQLLTEWQETGREFHFSTRELADLVQPEGKAERIGVEMAGILSSLEAIEHITEHESTFTRADLIRTTAELAQTEGISADRILEAVEETLHTKEVVSLGAAKEKAAIVNHPALSELRFTTQEILDLERELLHRVEQGRDKNIAVVPEAIVEKHILSRPTIKDEQTDAVRHITTCPSQFKTVTGQAGTGKTFMLAAARDAWVEAGYEVRGIAPSAKAASGLEEGANIPSSTIHSWLYALENGNETIGEKTVIVADEAGMIDTRLASKCIQKVCESGGSLVLVGDAGQLQAVQMGGAFAAIDSRLGHDVQLTDIIRQEKEADREAVKNIASGRADKALRHFQEAGQLSIAPDGEEARRALLGEWLKLGLSRPEEQLILTGTNLDATLLNREIQAERLRTQAIAGSRSVEANGETFYQSDRILFTRNSRAMGLQNGMLGTIEAVHPVINSIAVRIDGRNDVKTLSLNDYDHVKIGYALTTHKSQGATVKRAFVLTNAMMQSRELTYVQLSRARVETRVFTTEMEAGEELTTLVRSMERSRRKELAVEQQENLREQADFEADFSPRR